MIGSGAVLDEFRGRVRSDMQTRWNGLYVEGMKRALAILDEMEREAYGLGMAAGSREGGTLRGLGDGSS